MANILTMGRGKNKRQWELSDEEFEDFERQFEECELIDMSNFDPSKMKLTLTPPPARTPKTN